MLVESEVADFFVFSHIMIMGYFKLGYSKIKECPEWLEISEKLL